MTGGTRELRVERAPDPVFSELEGEVVMMSVENGAYYALDEVGSRIWEMLAEPMSLGDLCDALLEEYDVDPDTCVEDVRRLLEELEEEGLVKLARPSRE